MGEKIKLMVKLEGEIFECEAVVTEEASPSFTIGMDLLHSFGKEGWGMDPALWMLDPGDEDEVDVSDHIRINGSNWDWSYCSEDEALQEESNRQCDDLIRQHQADAVDGEEPGGLTEGAQYTSPNHALQGLWDGIVALKGEDLPPGPSYPTADDNPAEFRNRAEAFKPGYVHNHYEAWLKVKPTPDDEVLGWIQQGYDAKHIPEATGIRCRNSQLARENNVAVKKLLLKRLRDGSWESTKGETLDNITPIHIAPKESADPPWRWLVNARPAGEHYTKWRVTYEGIHTLPLVVKPNDWLMSIDLTSGYDCIKLTKECRGLFGVRLVFPITIVELLIKEGLLLAEEVGRVFRNGTAEIFARPVTLPQGFTLSCAVFTKLTRQVVRMWRARGYRLAHILDDFLFACHCVLQLLAMRCLIIEDLQKLGFFISWEKSILTPHKSSSGWAL